MNNNTAVRFTDGAAHTDAVEHVVARLAFAEPSKLVHARTNGGVTVDRSPTSGRAGT